MYFKKNLFKFKTILTLFICSAILIMLISGCTNNENQISGGTAQYQYYSEDNKPMDTYESYTLLEYINKKSFEGPFILYSADSIAKDSHPSIFVIENGKCRQYVSGWSKSPYTLGSLSKMSDEEIIKTLNDSYINSLYECLSDNFEFYFSKFLEKEYYVDDDFDRNAIELYKPISYDITTCLFTDDSGNYVESELILLPVKGVNGLTNIVQYPATDEYYLNCFSASRGQLDKFNQEFFYASGIKGYINETNELFHINNDSSAITTGAVYESSYYGFNTVTSDYSEYDGVLFFRDENAYTLNIGLDNLSSENILHIDPTDDDILDIYWEYYYNYYDNFSHEYYVECYDNANDL